MIPHELVSKYVIPYLRGLVASQLIEEGISQVAISKLLGITQPMVRKYLSSGRKYFVTKLKEVGIPEDEIEAIAKVLANTALRGGKYDLYRVFSQIINSILSRSLLCDFHRSIDPSIPKDCNLCSILFPQVTDPYIEDVKAAFKLMQSVSKAYTLVPEVGMNIVRASPNASKPEDIVGFTGRIIKVSSKLVAVGEPTYGGSKHTATVLLTIREKWSSINAIVVIKYDEGFIRRFEGLGLRLVFSGPHKSSEEFFKDLRRSIENVSKVPDVIVDLGGVGLEPVIYVLGESAVEAVRKALLAISSP